MQRMKGIAVAIAAVLSILALGGCENTMPDEAERAAVKAAVQGYLNALADAYSDLDASNLEGHASPQEQAAVHKLLKGLATTGDRVESTLRNFEVESMEIFREINATVTLIEIWDVVRVDAFSGREKGSNPGSVQNTILNLRLIDGKWLVTARRVIGDGGKPRWNVTTPIPDSTEENS